ncbi:schlafen-like protein 1 [Etheostoma cragini]|uniref:schlafen-like protein 1 n=1 Tax=Etheostoma cragini TaxID=417921 RepID=UPI00155EA02F|nr:schlafen-like protein 1 [Etheostoma cragini]
MGKSSRKRCDVSPQNQASQKTPKRTRYTCFQRPNVRNPNKQICVVRVPKGVKQQKSWRHPAASPQPQRPPVQDHTAQHTPAQHITRVNELDISSCQCLHSGAYIGNETSSIEFKQGTGNYMAKNFSYQVLKYGCAFLNSGGGSLLVGVQDNGVVCGLLFDHEKEDQTRLQVDDMVKDFEPPLLPHNYSLRFLPVITPGNQQHCLKVLCITFQVSPAFTEPTLYRVLQDQVYVRRNGSVQGPMGASFILEWSRQVWAGKVEQLKQHVCEATSERSSLAMQLHTLQKTVNQIAADCRIAAAERFSQAAAQEEQSTLNSQSSPASCENCRRQTSYQPDLGLGSTPPPELSHV